MIDVILLDSLYKNRLTELRELAESSNFSKSGSVEVLRARLIKCMVLSNLDLTWEGIQAISHKEMGEILKIFGIKSSGSHKERRQRIWLHINFDSRRMTIERLAELDRETLFDLCKKLEMPLTGTRTVLMGRVAGVLTNQFNKWGKIKRSIHRNGIQITGNDLIIKELINPVNVNVSIGNFNIGAPVATIEDARDLMISDIDKENEIIQGDLLSLQARVDELDRMIGTILKEYQGNWGEIERELLVRLTKRRGWPIEEEIVKNKLISVANDIAEAKGAIISDTKIIRPVITNRVEMTINRIRSKILNLNNNTK